MARRRLTRYSAGPDRPNENNQTPMSTLNDVVAFFGELPLFEGLAAEQLEDLARMVRPFRLEPHQVLFRQGDESDGLYVIRSGAVEVSARVPGDAALTLLRVGAGELLGEVALLDRGLRSATATAVAETSGYWFGRRHFELLRADLKPTSLHLMRRLIDNTCRSVHRAHERIAALLRSGPPRACRLDDAGRRLADGDGAAVRYGALPFFRKLAPAELRDVLAAGRLVRGDRGATLYRQGDPPQEVFFVLRGAASTLLECDTRSIWIGVDPPGSVVGVLGALAARPHATSCIAREDCIVLALDRTAVEALRATPRPISWHLTDHLHTNLVHLLRRCTDVASRLDLERQLPISRTEPFRV